MSDVSRRSWDVVVVGAGPAGSLTARELARRGLAVLLVERKSWPRAKVCGACVSAGAAGVLRDVGLAELLPGLGAVPTRELALAGWGVHARVPLPGTWVVSRASLDAALAEAAVAEGATFLPGTRARLDAPGREGHAVHLSGRDRATRVRTRLVIAADGVGGTLLAEARGAGAATAPTSRIGLGGVLAPSGSAYPPGIVYMAVAEGGYVGLVRQEDGRLNVAAAVDPHAVRSLGGADGAVRAILRRAGMPDLPEADASTWTGTPALTRRPEAPGAERLLAVGDASGYVEPFTGEGIAWALAGAVALAPLAAEAAEAWRPGLLERWSRERERQSAHGQRLCRVVAWTLRRPLLSRTALRAVARVPGLARPFVVRATSGAGERRGAA